MMPTHGNYKTLSVNFLEERSMNDSLPPPKSPPSSVTRKGYLSEEELAELDRKTALCVESTRKLYPHAGFTSDLLRELASKKPV